jgi:chromosome segregation ATPase
MLGLHIGEFVRTSTHDAQIAPAVHDVPAVTGASGACIEPGVKQTASFAAGGETDAGTHSVLRLRGGGGALGKRRSNGDRDRLLSSPGSSRRYNMAKREAIHGGEDKNAQLVAQRDDLQWRLDTANSRMIEASQQFRVASEQSSGLKTDIERLKREKEEAPSQSARKAELKAELRSTRAEYKAKIEEAATHHSAAADAGSTYFAVKQELALLRRE